MTTQKILIADDEPTVHESLGIYLKADGFETVDAYDGQETLDKLHAFDYDELDEVQKVHYKAYENYLENLMGMYRYPELQFMFRPYTGYLSNVMDYFADFMFLLGRSGILGRDVRAERTHRKGRTEPHDHQL